MRYPQSTNLGNFGAGTRHAAPSNVLVEAISVTAEICGRPLSPAALEILAQDLADFDETLILAALARCRMELQGPLKAPDILVRIDDGRPDADQAWAMMPKDEAASVVWTDEMALAWGVAAPLLNAGDIIGSRMAFREIYTKAVLDARIHRKPVHWVPSLGSDVAGRESVLIDAVQKRHLTAAHVEKLLPSGAVSPQIQELLSQVKLKKLH